MRRYSKFLRKVDYDTVVCTLALSRMQAAIGADMSVWPVDMSGNPSSIGHILSADRFRDPNSFPMVLSVNILPTGIVISDHKLDDEIACALPRALDVSLTCAPHRCSCRASGIVTTWNDWRGCGR
jgi:hypothetical protein